MYPRNLKAEVLEAAQYCPVILVNGARQTGKSTLARGLFEENRPTYISLDDISTLGLAKSSPKSFVQNLQGRAVIDEVQRAPELFLPLKEVVDSSRKTCRFLLTGSANALSLPELSDSLAGRMEVFTLWTLSQGEIRGKRDAFIDLLFSKDSLPQVADIKLPDLLNTLTTGGYPDILGRPTGKARRSWYRGYLSSILERDVRTLSRIEGLTELPNLLSLVASRAGGLHNLADLSRSLGIPYMTLKRYLALLEAVYLIVPIQPWSKNIGKRLSKAQKLFLNDTGLLCHLIGRDSKALETDRTLLGCVFENFVLMELLKQVGWSQSQPSLYHFRTVDNSYEVDFVLESPDGKIVAIECKASSEVNTNSFKGIRFLKEHAGDRFHRGIVLYTGTNTLAFAQDLIALPVSALWETANEAS